MAEPVTRCECGYRLLQNQDCPECGRSFSRAIHERAPEPLSRKRFAMFAAIAALAGAVWYAVLLLPVSPVSHQLLIRSLRWPDACMAVGMLALASLLAALPLVRLFRSASLGVVSVGGILFTLLSGTLFGLLAALGASGSMPSTERAAAAIIFAGYGLLYALLSGHVAFPTGVALAFVFRRILRGVPR